MHRENTIIAIANELNLSRNTVSKVINGKPGVSEKTRKLVERYLAHSPSETIAEEPPSAANNTILFSYYLENVEYINGLLAGIEKTLKENGFLLALHIIENARSARLLPASVYNGTVCGIISFNIYNRQYWQEVASLSIPSVFFDSPIDNRRFIGSTDIVIPENSRAIYELVAGLHRSGRRNFGYLGDPYYCLSLLQRWQAFQGAVEETGLALNMNQCILDNFADATYFEKFQIVKARIQQMNPLPDAFICASDWQAIMLLGVLKELSLSVPQDVAISGFDNLPETLRQSPPLTTVDAYSKFQGELAVRKILERLACPEKPHEIIHCQSSLILRESTGII